MKGVIQRRLDEAEARFKVLVTGQIDAVAGPQGPILLSRAQSALAAAMQASERNLRAVTSNELEMVGTMEGNGVVRFVNSGIVRALGWTPEDCIGEPATRFIHPDDRDIFRSLLARVTVRSGRAVGGGIRALVSGGGIRRLYVALSNHLDDPSIGLVVGRAADASEDYQGNDPYRLSFEFAPDALIVADADGLTISLNPEATRLFGYTHESLVGRPIEALFRLDDDGGRSLLGVLNGVASARALAQSHVGLASRVVCLRSDGTTFPAEIWLSRARVGAAAGAHVAVAVRDLTNQSRLENARRESEALLTSTFDSIGDAVVATDRRGRVTRLNRVAERLTGWAATEAVGRPLEQVFSAAPESEGSSPSPGFEELMEGIAQIPPHARLIGRNGTERIIAQTGTVIQALEGRASGVLFAFRDMTRHREMEQQIQVSNRMLSIGTIAAGVAHEINNPLSGLIGNLFLLSELLTSELRPVAGNKRGRAAAPEKSRWSSLQTILREAIEAAERVRGIVREIKLFSRGEEDASVPVSVDKVLESSLRMTRNEVRHRARVVKEGHVKPLVMASESRLGQVFVNLMINAAHSIPEGHAEENEIHVSLGLDPQGQVIVQIRDSGQGIAPEILPHIFDPFFTTKEVGVGTGLGLTICKRIVGEIGGTITVESTVGKGTTFRVCLPAFHLDPLAPRRPRRTRSLEQRRGRVLVIDDEPLVRLSIERVLTGRHDVVSEARAEDALARLTRGERFDVILCDVMMPQMTGIEFRQSLEAAHPEQAERIVFMTAGAFVGGTGRLIESAVNAVIEKPMDMHRLRALVADFVSLAPPNDLQASRDVPSQSPPGG